MTEQYTPARPRRFRRVLGDRRLGGVCAGIAAQLGVDPAVVRVLVLVGALAQSRIVVGSYFLLWLLTPDDEEGPRGAALAWIGTSVAGLAILGRTVQIDAGVGERVVVPVAVAVISAVVLLLPPRRPVSYGTLGAGEIAEAAPPIGWEARPPSSERGERSLILRLTVGVAFVAVNAAMLAGASARTVAATALLAIAAGLLAGTVRGNGRPLVPVAAAAALALATTHHATVPAATEASGTYLRPSSITELRDHRALTGAVTLDLSRTDWVLGRGVVERSIEVVAGHVVVILPAFGARFPGDLRAYTYAYAVQAGAGIGTTVSPDRQERGFSTSYSVHGAGGKPDERAVELKLIVQVRFGTVEVRHATA